VPLLEAEPTHSTRLLLTVGVPSFIFAVILSMCIHQYAHTAVRRYSCGAGHGKDSRVVAILNNAEEVMDCPPASLAAILTTLGLALGSFGLFIHHPRNIFLASMAFVNAASRLPESFIVLFQFVVRRKATHVTDESVALQLLHFKDPTAFIVILCFYTLTILFLSITIIHDVKMIPRKWLVAAILFLGLLPLENLLWNILIPLFSSS
jgi:hypothetical protein